MVMAGFFLTLEGIDGAGKSSHIAAIAAALQAQGHTVTLTREPGGTPLAEKLRTLVLNDAMDPLTEALLIFAARRDHVQQVIAPALARGEVVLCDRFTDATFAYQGAGRGFSLEVLSILERWIQSPLGAEANLVKNPDLTLWFDLPPAIAAERLADARLPDRFEAQPQAFFERVSQGYAARLQADPARFSRINAHQPRDAVWAEVLHALRTAGCVA